MQMAIFVGVCFCSAAFSEEEKTKVFVARKIVTLDPGWSTATAVAVREGKILSVGSMDDLKPWLDKYPYDVDNTFADKVIMPGFIEAHGHPLLGGYLLQLPLVSYQPIPSITKEAFKGLKTRDEAVNSLANDERSMKDPKKPLLAWGFDSVVFGGHLTRQELDKISATRPIYVQDASEHFVYLNSAAIQQRGFTPDLAKKIIGVGLTDGGELNGQFLGTTAAVTAIGPFFDKQLKGEAGRQNIDYMVGLSLKGGITTQSELALGLTDVDAQAYTFDRYFNDPDAPMRCVVVTDIAGLIRQKGANALNSAIRLQGRSTDKLIFHGVKSFADDSFLGFGMAMENPGYIDGHQGVYNNNGLAFYQQLKPFWDAGFQIHIHTNGNGGQADTIEVLKRLQAAHPRFDHRFTFQHFGIATPAQIKDVKALGAIVSVNPYYVYYRGEINAPYIGADRAYTADRLHTILENGITASLHSDAPIGAPCPLEWVWIAVNRFGQSGKVLAPEERVSVGDALKMITINAAYTLGVDDKLGSIEPGKFADFTVLEADPYQVPPEKLREIKIWGTVVGGTKHPVEEAKSHGVRAQETH
jgi:predicted amidohydrolase YtcJ